MNISEVKVWKKFNFFLPLDTRVVNSIAYDLKTHKP